MRYGQRHAKKGGGYHGTDQNSRRRSAQRSLASAHHPLLPPPHGNGNPPASVQHRRHHRGRSLWRCHSRGMRNCACRSGILWISHLRYHQSIHGTFGRRGRLHGTEHWRKTPRRGRKCCAHLGRRGSGARNVRFDRRNAPITSPFDCHGHRQDRPAAGSRIHHCLLCRCACQHAL